MRDDICWEKNASSQGCTKYCELLTCVLVSPTPQVSTDHIDSAFDEEEDMKHEKGHNGVSKISEIVLKKCKLHQFLEHLLVSPNNITCAEVK